MGGQDCLLYYNRSPLKVQVLDMAENCPNVCKGIFPTKSVMDLLLSNTFTFDNISIVLVFDAVTQ